MQFQVQLYTGGVYMPPEEYHKLVIASASVDRVINEVYSGALGAADDAYKDGEVSCDV